MQYVLENWKELVEAASYLVFGICIIATTIVNLTPSNSDNEKLDKIYKKIMAYMAYMPTIGINPKTKMLEKWYDDQKK